MSGEPYDEKPSRTVRERGNVVSRGELLKEPCIRIVIWLSSNLRDYIILVHSHIGFILLALIIHNAESYQAFLFYILQYILTNLNAFLIVIAIGFSLYLYFTNLSETNNLSEKINSPIQLISQLKGYFSINPLLTLCLAITIFSFVGLPPLSGFFAKQMVLITALDKTLLVLIAILTSVISAVYYSIIVKTLYFDKAEYKKSYVYIKVSISNYLSITISILTIIVLFFILMPNEPIILCNLLSLIYST